MKEFVQVRDGLIIEEQARGYLLNEIASNAQMSTALSQLYRVGAGSGNIVDTLTAYLDDMESTVNLIFDGIESKIRYIEQYCDLVTSSSLEVPEGSIGTVYIFDMAKTKRENTAYSVGLGIILETN